MDSASAQLRLEFMVAWDQDPVLSAQEVLELVRIAARPDVDGNSPLNIATAAPWAASTLYVAGSVIIQTVGAHRWWRCQTSGISAATTPLWPSLGGTDRGVSVVNDGTVVWGDNGADWAPTWDLEASAAEGWRWKAGKAASRFGFTTDGQQFAREQVIANCFEMAARYARRDPGTTATPRP